MARKVTVELVDDFDGESVAEETVHFALDGVEYELDLSKLNTARLQGIFERWTIHARRVGGRKLRGKNQMTSVTDRAQTQAIREWARTNGLGVSSRGRVSSEIVAAYDRATN
ncbi:Lsr2 family protein [Nocardia sp. NPDC005745]|uniref:histone-like nucleoid-structuring protein Lsr2 n=1 Tax=Nocardia sp. NPDC005745 TaxID=3157061 RepID=UPI0033C42BD9